MRVTGRLLITVVSMVAITGCGGGGGGGGGGGSSAGTSLTLDKASLDFVTDHAMANPPAAQTIVATFRGDGMVVGTLPGAMLPPWLSVSAPQNSGSPVTVTVTPNRFDLIPGRHTTTLRFATGKADGSDVVTRDVNVSYTVDHALTPAVVRLGVTTGVSAGPTATLTLTTANATWEATSNQPWLQVAPASGNREATLAVSTSAASLAPGVRTGTITVRDTVTGRSRSVTVELNVIPRRLEALPRGVALSSTSGGSLLSRQIRVVDTGNQRGRWRASSDVPWLQFDSPTGMGGDALSVTADPAGLAEGIHYATVTIAPDNEPSFANQASVRVGLYVDRTSAVPPDTLTTGNILSGHDLVADPIRPYFYITQSIRDPATSSYTGGAVSVYNAYTAQLVETLSFPDRRLSNAAISQDGSLLVIVDHLGRSLVPISLQESTRSAGVPWTGMRHNNLEDEIDMTQVGGTEVVVTSERQVLSAVDGTVLASFEVDWPDSGLGNIVAAAPDGSAAYVMWDSIGNHRIARIALSGFNGTFRAERTHSFNESGDASDMIVNQQGTRLITLANDSRQPLRMYDSGTMMLAGAATGIVDNSGTVDVSFTGDIYITGRSGYLTQFAPDLTRLGAREMHESHSTALGKATFSGDGRRGCALLYGTSGVAYVRLRCFDAALPP